MKLYMKIKPSTKLYLDLRRDQMLSVALAPHLIFRLNRAKEYLLEEPSDAAIRAYEDLPLHVRSCIELIGSSKGRPTESEVLSIVAEIKAVNPITVEDFPSEEPVQEAVQTTEEKRPSRRGRKPSV